MLRCVSGGGAAIALSVFVMAGAGCKTRTETASGTKTLQPVVRFVDQAARPDASILETAAYELYRRLGGSRPLRTARLPSATIGNETRYVLVAPPTIAETVAPEAVTLDLPAAFDTSSRAVARISKRRGLHWSEPETSVVEVHGAITLDENREAEIFVEAFGESADLLEHRTQAITVPSNASLVFGAGLLPATTAGSRVRQTIEACAGDACSEIFRYEATAVGGIGSLWNDHAVSLAEQAGKSLSFRFRATPSASDPAALLFPVWSNPTLYAPSAAAARPSVILISLDTLRADRLPSYGYDRDTAPFIDATFATGGAVFEDCTSAAASTPPGHMTIMTSLEPSIHGVRRGDETLDPILATLAETLRADGLTTAAVTENGWLVAGQGFGRGFESYVENKATDIESPSGEIATTLATARAWIERHRDTPFFLFLHTYQVHDPYAPPAAYAELFSEFGEPDSDSLRYDQEIRYTDDQLREFMADIATLRGTDDLIVVITSDHGEGFLEHGHLLHSTDLYQEIVHVPCILWGTGVPVGQRIDAPIGTIDLAPTIARLAGAPLPRQFRGLDLTPLFDSDDAGLSTKLRARTSFSEAWGNVAAGPGRTLVGVLAPTLSARRGTLKAVRSATDAGVRYEAYDVATDPRERVNLIDDTPGGTAGRADAAVAELRSALDGYLESMRDARAHLLGVRPESLALDPRPNGDVAPAVEEKLRALGYLE